MRSYSTFVLSFLQKTTTIVGVLLLCYFVFSHDASAATFSFAPASGTYTVGSTISVGVYAGSSDKALNAASGVVSFPEDLLEVISISKNQSVMSLWVQEPSFSNTAGTVNYEGIVLNPGYTGANGKIITVNFRVKAQGTATLSFVRGSILANDGSGTEVLTAKGTALFSLMPKAPVVSTETVAVPVSSPTDTPLPKIESSTHVADGWSNQTTGTFNFAINERVTAMRLLLDDQPNSIPVVVYEPPVPLREITDIAPGVSYLHVQYKTGEIWGEVLHYKLNVDIEPPTDFRVTNTTSTDVVKETTTFELDARDALSGIDHFEVQIDGAQIESFVAQGVYTYTTPTGLVAGTHTMTVKAFDRAGNFLSTTTEFVNSAPLVAEPQPLLPLQKEQPFMHSAKSLITLLSVVIPIVSLFMLLSWLTFTTWRAYGGLKKKIAGEVLDAKMVMHKAFALMRDDLVLDIETLKKASIKRKLTREEAKILKRLQKNINEAEKVITTEMTNIEDIVE